VRFAGAGHRRPTGPAQLRACVLHARGGRSAWSNGMRRAGVAGVWPEPGPVVRVARRRRFRGGHSRPATGAGPVGGLLLRHRGAPSVLHDWTGERPSYNNIVNIHILDLILLDEQWVYGKHNNVII